MPRRQRGPFWLALAGFVIMAGALAIFFTWTCPADQATSNRTAVPPDWQELRVRWEHPHPANAALTFAALCPVTLSGVLGATS
jgi:hypothetical protein